MLADGAEEGSSPHMRGTEFYSIAIKLRFGIIPVHAGNRLQGLIRYGTRWDHPRTCGEQQQALTERGQGEGSSPHMRGTVRYCYRTTNTIGIIPAHAGNSDLAAFFYPALRDHPRTCGEQGQNGSSVFEKMGSSPHMRGTAHCWLLVHRP